ncbi:hypothetical protein FA13DRAFT_1756427 [Coprinellus micaceus]|uniref:Nucleoporin protein Ndc1-Nup n=1 Tax=Coprinellus micaceus TaxID=71717 RepID=A0A4Y7SWN3_COPMI|nr:hypothetical protein FA13DRAFT_1756427 [Coprinellus micaceus]
MSSTPSGSRFRTSTPVQAKPSTIVNRSSPSLPPASQTYEPQVKSVLRIRLSRVFIQSALLCWLVNTVWAIWQNGGVGSLGLLSAPFGPLTLLGSAALWFATAVPAIVLRKMFLTGKRTAATSPQKSLAAALAKPSTKPALSDDKARLTIFVKSRKHPQYLNGRFLFILITQLLGAATYLFRNVLRDRFAFKWVGMSSGAPSVVLQVMVAFFVSTVSITATIPLACTAFALIRVFILPTLYQLPFVRIALRPFTAHFLRGPYTLSLPFRHIQLLARSWFVGLTTLFLWEATEYMFDGMLSEPVHVAAPNPTILVSGTSSEDPIMKYFAYAELSKVTATSLAQRQTLFGDQNNVPNVWGAFVREALLLLGKDYQRLLGRGAEDTPEQTKPAAPSTPMAKPIPGTPTPLLRQSILRSQAGTRESVLDSIASDGPLAKAVEQTTEAAHIPELFRSVKEIVANVEKAAGPGFVQRVKTAIRKRVDDSFDQHAPARVKEEVEKFGKWWTEDRLSRTVDACLPMRELDVVVMEVLTKLVCASLSEDRYGNPSPKELEERELMRVELDKATDVLAYVGDGLKDGIARIVRTFGDKLTAFKFPPRTAAKLQGFMDFCQ